MFRALRLSRLICGGRKVNSQKRFIFLIVVLILGVSVLVLHRKLRNHSRQRPTEPTIVYRVRNLTYLEELNDAKVNMNDPLLITAIRKTFLRPPLPLSVPYKLKNPFLDAISMEMAENIAYMLCYEINGFFVEVRAHDGEMRSNTLILERRLNWTGLLVEPDPIKFAQIVKKKRKVWLSPSCLGIFTYPHVMTISQDLNTGETSRLQAGPKKVVYTDVQCLPLYSLLLALNRTVVDYLSLDVKGNELDVLKTIPFKDLNIRTLSLDYAHEQMGKGIMLQYMQNQGYDLHASTVHPDDKSVVFVFVKNESNSEL